MNALNKSLPTTSPRLYSSFDILYMCIISIYVRICVCVCVYTSSLRVATFDITTSRSGVTGGFIYELEISETKAGDSRWNALFLVERSVPARPYQALRSPARMRKPCRRRRSVIASASFNVLAAAIVRRISPRIRAASHDPELKRKRRVGLTRTAAWSETWRFANLIKTRIKLPRSSHEL